MAVLGRLLLGSAERLDLPDLLSVDSYTAADFKYLIQSFIGADNPYILRGFDIIQPQDSIGTESISIRIADSVAYYPTATAGSFYFGLEEGNTNAQPLVPDLRKNATNFVYLTLTTFDTAKDSRAFWDPDQNGGAGGEFSQDINTESALKVEVGISVSTFPENTIPIAKVVVGPSVITSIEDSRDLMFRLGTGGTSPDPFATYAFRNNPSGAYQRDEPSTVMTSPLDANPFQGGDKNIYTLKEWMDVVMTTIKEITGGTYWYSASGGGSSGGINLPNIYEDALGSTLKSKGEWIHDELVGGRVTWTEDVVYHSLTDPRELIIRANTVDIVNNDEVAYINIIRQAEINGTSTSVNFLGTTEVTGVSGAFANLAKGDWVKKVSDNDYLYLRVEEFYTSPGFVGLSTPALAQSIRLSGTYAGSAGSDVAEYTKGEYLLTDINIEPRDTSTIDSIGGNFFWLAYRTDTNLGFEGATPTQLSIDFTDADGVKVTCTSVGHGLEDEDRITVTTGGYAGTHQVSVEDANIFYINTAITGDEAAQTAFYAIVETRARDTGYTYALESANHGFESNQRVNIQDSLSAYNGSYLINVRSSTTFQIPIGSLIANPGNVDGDIVTLVRVNVKTEFGTVKVIQGESIDIGDPDTSNILSYIGMSSLAMTAPVYNLPLSYNALNGFQNWNCASDDDLTTRAAKLTAMMADRVQDRGLSLRGRVNITQVTNGLNQDISATGNLTLHKPSSPEQAIDLTTIVSLPANSAAVARIDRDGAAAITPTIIGLGNSLMIGENDLIMFYRFAGTEIYTWDDQVIQPSGHLNLGYVEDSSNRNVFVFNPGRTDFNIGTGLLSFDITSCPETTQIQCLDTSAMDVVGAAQSWLLNSAIDATAYYVWYDVTDGANSQTDPATATTGIKVDVLAADTDDDVATKTAAAIGALGDFSATSDGNAVTVTNVAVGLTTDASDVDSGFSFVYIAQGVDPDVEIVVNGSADVNTIDTGVVNGLGTLVIPAGSAAWVRVNRFAAKTFNTVQTSDVPDTDIAGAIYVTPIVDVPIDQDVFVLWMRNGDNLLEMHKASPPDDNIYDERLDIVVGVPADDNELQGPISAATLMSLPLDSRDTNSVQQFIVGAGQLEVELNGQVLILNGDYVEVGTAGCPSNQIQISQGLAVGDALKFRVATKGSVFFASAGLTGGTMQDTYDNGRFVTVNSGQPIVLSGPIGEKLLVIQGDLDVTGVIDPTGLELTPIAVNPLSGGSNGIWVNLANELVYEGTNISMSELKIGTTVLTEAQLTTLKTLQDGSDILAAVHHHDNRYYTEVELDAGQLDNRYYTETELDAGQLDNRYYTETELDAGQLDNRYYTETELDAGQLDNRYFTEVELQDTSSNPGALLVGDNPGSYANILPVTSQQEVTQVTINNAGTSFDVVGNGLHWLLNSALDAISYYVWYNVTDGANAQADPAPGGTGIQVDILDADSVNTIAMKTSSAINVAASADFTASFLVADVTITNDNGGATTDASDVDSTNTVSTLVQGTTVAGSGTVRNTLLAIDATLGAFSKLFVTKTNNTGAPIPAGTVVCASQTIADEIIVANATALASCEGTFGVTTAIIANGVSGQVQISGEVTVLGSTSLGKRVYLSDATAGQAVLEANIPTALNSVAFLVGITVDTGRILLTPRLEYVNE